MTTIEDKIWNGLTVLQKKELIILFQNQQVKKVDFEFCDDVWSVIKEYAGIYHIGTEWPKVTKLSAAKLYKWYRTGPPRVYIDNLSGKSAEFKRKRILYWFSKEEGKHRRNEEEMNSLYSLLPPGGWTCKDFTKYKVGQTILYDDVKDNRYKLCVIKKVNKASINVDIKEPAGWSSILQEVLDEETTINKTIRSRFKVRDEFTDNEESIYLRILGYNGKRPPTPPSIIKASRADRYVGVWS